MDFLYKRPLFAFCFAFVVGSAFFFSFSKYDLFLCLIVAALSLIPAFLFKRKNIALISLIFGFLFASVFSLFMVHYRYRHLAEYNEKNLSVSFTVLEITERDEDGNAVSVEGYIESLNGEWESITAKIYFEEGEALAVGERFQARGRLSYSERIERRDLFSGGSQVSFTVLLQNKIGKEPLLYCIGSWRQMLDERIRSAGDGDSAALLAAILFGYRDNLSAKVNINFRQTGFTHAIAVSGLNLTILIGIVFLLLKLLHLPYKSRIAVSVLFAVLYSALSGFCPSVSRAAFMASILLVARLFRRPHDPPTTLFFSAAVLLLFDHSLAEDASFLLSVMATFGLIVVGAILEKEDESEIGVLRRLVNIFFSKEGFLLSLGAIAATLLISAVLFREFSVLSPISTALLSPLVTLILWLAIPLLVFPESFIGKAADAVAEAIIFFIDLLAEIPNTRISLSFPLVIPVIFAGSFVSVALIFGKKRSKWIVATPFLLTALIIFGAARINSITYLQKEPVIYLSEGTAEETLCLSDGNAVLFDTAGNRYGLTKSMLSKIYDSYVTELSAYVVTDYTEALPETLSLVGGYIKTREFLLPMPKSEEEAVLAEKALLIAKEYGVKYTFYRSGEELSVGNASLLIYRADAGDYGDILYSLRTENGILTYVSSGFHLHGDIRAANNAVLRSNSVIIGAYNASIPTHIPYTVDKETLKYVLWSDTSVTKWRGEENAAVLKEKTVVFDPASDEFLLKELS